MRRNLVRTRSHLAGTINSLVGIGSFSGDTMLRDEVESSVHKTTIATFVTVLGTINQVLFGERSEFLGREEESTFNSTSGGERPARTALTLILNRSDGTLSGPVNFDTSIVEFSERRSLKTILHLQGKVSLLEFFSGNIHELGDTIVLGVAFNNLKVFSEDFDSVAFEVGISVLLVVLSLESRPESLDILIFLSIVVSLGQEDSGGSSQ